jgi:hypothetical protein
MCWQAAILDQEISPPPLAVKKIFQFLEAATALEHQDWVLERQVLEHWKWVLDLQAASSTSTCQHLSSSLMSMICFEFSLRPENKANTKTH